MNKKVLITGGAGFIGLSLANRFLDEGYKVDIVDNYTRAVHDIELDQTLYKKNVRFFDVDLLNDKFIVDFDIDYDLIFHLAAIIGVAHVLESPYSVLFDNINMLNNVIKLAHKQKNIARLFFASTSEVYAGTLKYFDLSIPTSENTPLAITDTAHPRTSYMLSKIYGEALCQQSGLPFTIFRPHNVYGPRMGMSHVIPEQLSKAYNSNNGDNIDVFSINHTRCFCYIDDAIEMLWRMAKCDSCVGKILNLGTQNPEVTMKEVAEACFLVTGKKLNVNAMPSSPGSPSRRAPDMNTTINLIGFKSKVSLIDGIKYTYKWYKNNIFEGKEITAK